MRYVLGKYMICIKNLKTLENFLTNFGDLFRRFSIDFDVLNEEIGQKIIGLINDKSFSTLKKISLKNCTGNILDKLTNTFSNVYRLEFSSNSVQKKLIYHEENRKIYEIFPDVSHLILVDTKTLDWKLLNGKFPRLNSMDLEYPKKKESGVFDEIELSNFSKLNKKVRDIRIKNTSLKTLKQVNDDFPKLDSLIIDQLAQDYFNYEGDVIEFYNVRELTIKTKNENDIPLKLLFNGIISMSLYVDATFTENWNDFLSKQSFLASFTLYTISINTQQFLEIPNHLKNVISIKIDCLSKYTAHDIVIFIEKCNVVSLIKLYFIMDSNEQILLQQALSNSSWLLNIEQRTHNVNIVIKR